MLTLLAALIPVVSLLAYGSVVQVPFVALGPGPTFNTLGEVDGKPVVVIEGTELDPTSGNLNMTTVSVRDGLTVFDAFGFWLSGRYGLVPRDEVYPSDRSRDEVREENAADFAQSEETAELAALHFLGKPVALVVTEVAEDGPSHDLLQVDDQIVAVDAVEVQTVGDVQRAVADLAPGTGTTIAVDRGGRRFDIPVTLGARPGHPDKGYLGITPTEQPEVPFTVSFNLAEVGGPSAGLMFALAVVDKLSPGELNGGTFVAGTGTIDSDGNVGPIGGIPYKMTAAREAGASTFLVPAKNCDEASRNAPDGLRLVRVDDLTGAVSALETINAGGDAPSC